MKHILFILLLSLLGAACGHKHDHDHGSEAGHGHGEAEGPVSDIVSLSPEQAQAIDIRLGRIEQKQLTASLKANGVLKVPNQNRATVSSLFSGSVSEILVQPGNTVRKGQTLAVLINPQFIQLQEEYLTLQTRIQLAEIELKRQQELSSGLAGSLKNFQQSEQELAALRIRRSSLSRQLALTGIAAEQLSADKISSRIAIRSPLQGTVGAILVNIGSPVDLNTPIAEVVDNRQLHLDLYVYEKDLPKMKVGQTIHFTLTNNPGKEYDADIYGISNTFEDATKAIAVHASVKGDKNGLIDGMNITALVSLEEATLPAVPTEAIVSYQGQDYIFVERSAPEPAKEEHPEDKDHADHPGHERHEGHDQGKEDHSHETEAPAAKGTLYFERVPVRKGTTDVGYSEITLLKDLPGDLKVVVKGAFFILAKQTNSGGGHSH